MKKIVALAFVAVLFLGSCSPFNIKSDYDQKVNFSQIKTYSIKQDNLNLNDLDKARVIDAVRQQLRAKGYQESNNPDIYIYVNANHKKIEDVQTTSPWGMYGGWGWGGGFGWGWGGIGYSRTYTDVYNRGSLTFDFVDARTNVLIWQGIGSGLNVDNPKTKAKQIPQMIAEVFQNYPPQPEQKK